jgi:hypothetical protein
MSRFPANSFTTRIEPSAADVSAAVLAVLRDMAVAGSQNGHAAKSSVRQVAGGELQLPAFSGLSHSGSNEATYAFPGKLLLERHAVGLPESTRQILTSPSTVVTPLAREILRKRGVTVRISNASGLGLPKPVLAGEWAVVRLCESPQAQSLEAMLVGRGGEGWVGFGPSAEAAVEWLESQPAGHLALLAQSACTALWWAIRQGVRAAQVHASADVERIVAAFAPRCVVIEPARMAIHESRQLFRTWRAMGLQMPTPGAVDSPLLVQEARS